MPKRKRSDETGARRGPIEPGTPLYRLAEMVAREIAADGMGRAAGGRPTPRPDEREIVGGDGEDRGPG